MKKKFKAIGTAALFAIALAGCNNDGSSSGGAEDTSKGAMDNYKVGTTFKAEEPIEFSIMYSDHPNYPYKEDWLIWEDIKNRTNVTLEPTIIPMSDYEQKRSLLISSGDSPLIIPKTYPGQEAAFVSSGAVLPISDYVEKMPNFQDKVEKWGLEEELEGLRQEDGKYYVLPGLHENVWPDYTLAVRTDIFKENNIPIPSTWDELYTALKQLKAAYPDVTPFSDRYQFNSTLNIASVGFGTKAEWGTVNGTSYDEEKDEFVYAAMQDEYKDLLTYFNKLVVEGLLDKESFTQNDEQAIQKFVSGKSFVINANSQDIVTYRNSMNEILGEGNFEVAKITVPGGPAGQLMAGTRLENGVMLSSKAAESENFDAMLQFIDWLYYSDEGQEFAKWGIEGETFTKENGKRTLAADVNYNGLNPSGTTDLRVDYGFSSGVFAYGGTTDLLQSMMSSEEIEFQNAMKETKTVVAPDPAVPFSELDREQATLLSTPLKDYTNQNTLQFILGTRDLSEFETFKEELKTQGADKYLDLVNKTYKEK